MQLSNMLNDTVTLQRKNGDRIEEIKANVQAKKIFIYRYDILIETGDLIERKMTNGGKETYEVIDPGFHESFHGIEAHYQITHRKLGVPEAKAAAQNITYHISGSNARVNNHSTDNSVNTVNITSDVSEHISMLRAEVKRLLPGQDQKPALEVVDAIEGQFESSAPSKVVVETLLGALPSAGSIASIGSFLLSALGA
ncbi:hypothetical protein U0O11_16635 [Cobetia sp. D5]|uniref:hypothetical protein n=1 Tax=Cobetia TaxID=204286 RepID=UPI00254DF6DD|nr:MULTISPECIES: hypothetical protein [Cobetia]